MTCSGGVCAPTAKSAMLNVGDLETLLASGNVTVTTTGTGVQADDINVKVALSWSSTGALSLLANKSVTVDNPVSVAGLGGLTVTTGGKTGTFSFGKRGNVTFANLSSQLTINGTAYTLVGDIKTLASDIANIPNDNFALANNYDASGDGTYHASPIPTQFTGTFLGLGNTISNLSIASAKYSIVALSLFAEVGVNGIVADIGLLNAHIFNGGKYSETGTLVADNSGTIISSYASGIAVGSKEGNTGGLAGINGGMLANSYANVAVSGKDGVNGGLVGSNGGKISKCHATGAVSGGSRSGFIGGLVGENGVGENGGGNIDSSYATGAVSKGPLSGGLVGANSAPITNSFATGDVSGFDGAGGLVGGTGGTEESIVSNSYSTGAVSVKLGGGAAGGLIGVNGVMSTVGYSYSTGTVAGGMGSLVGGLIGIDDAQPGSITDTYWDTDTSGITNLSQGAGNVANDPGITGLTTVQFQSGLPAGFDPTVWAEKPNINDGFPYLLANKPPGK